MLFAVKGDRNLRHPGRVVLRMPFTAYAGNIVHKSTLINVWHRVWRTVRLENVPADEHFEGFITSIDKQMVSNIVTYAKILSAKSVSYRKLLSNKCSTLTEMHLL
jgi:hypothetical protein